MHSVLTLWRKELTSAFLSPIAYATLTFFLVVMGAIFYLLTSLLAGGVPNVDVMSILFGSPFYWLTQLVVIPLLTMRLFAEERRMGTLETLLTAPVTDAQVVAAKFAGAWSFYLLMWAPTALFLAGLGLFSAEAPPLDPGVAAAGYLGVALSGGFFLSVGLLCSLTTSNQIIAAITCFCLLALLMFTGFMEVVSTHPVALAVAGLVSPNRHMQEFARGVVDSRAVIFYLTGMLFLLFTATRLLESRQWR